MPLLHLQRPGWERHPHAADLWWVDDMEGARDAAGLSGIRPFVTTEQQHPRAGRRPPGVGGAVGLGGWSGRGPFTYAAELALMVDRGIDVLVTKDCGGALTEAKLAVAHELQVPVVVVRRPPPPDGAGIVERVDDAAAWVRECVGPRPLAGPTA